jgi:hypothetical protein
VILSFRRSDRILHREHRHDALPSLEGALQIWSLPAYRAAPPPLTSQAILQMQRREAQVRDG